MIIGLLMALFLTSSCGNDSADAHKLIQVNTAVFTFSDGENVSTWKYPNNSKLLYLLQDGTEILATHTIRGPENAIVGGVEPIAALEQTAQDKIIAFYEGQGALYNLEEYLERAYAEYTLEKSGATFQCDSLIQETVPSASNEEIIYCTTTLCLPLEQGIYDEYSLTRAFDKKSGDSLDSWDLFVGTEDTVKTTLLSDYTTDSETLAILYSDFRPEYVRFYPDGYEIVFPCETSTRLAAGDHTPPSNIAFSNRYTDKVLSILNVWAIPQDNGMVPSS